MNFFTAIPIQVIQWLLLQVLAHWKLMREEGLLTRATSLADYWQQKLHSLADHPYVIDIRNIGLIGAIELKSIDGSPTQRAFNAFLKAFEKVI